MHLCHMCAKTMELVFVSHLSWVLESELRSCVIALNH